MSGAENVSSTHSEIFDELAVGWALHALEPDDEAMFTGHLRNCGRCARTVAETTEVMGALAFDATAAEPSEQLRHRLRAAVEATAQVRDTDPVGDDLSAPTPPRTPASSDGPAADSDVVPLRTGDRVESLPAWRRAVPRALVAAGVAAVLALGAWNVVVSAQRDDAVTAAAEQGQMLDTLLDESGNAVIAPVSGNHGKVATVVARDAQVQVISQGLDVNDRHSQTYVLWGMMPAGSIPLGTFDVVQSGTDLRTVGSSATGLDDFTAYAISIEPGRSAPSAPTEVVGRGQVTS